MNIGILSRNGNLVSTRRLVEAAIQRGHNARVINFTKCYVAIEHFNSKIFLVPIFFNICFKRTGAAYNYQREYQKNPEFDLREDPSLELYARQH